MIVAGIDVGSRALKIVILDGTARATTRGRHIADFAQADMVGEMALVTDEPRSADVVADTNVRALSLSSDDFHRLAGSCTTN